MPYIYICVFVCLSRSVSRINHWPPHNGRCCPPVCPTGGTRGQALLRWLGSGELQVYLWIIPFTGTQGYREKRSQLHLWNTDAGTVELREARAAWRPGDESLNTQSAGFIDALRRIKRMATYWMWCGWWEEGAAAKE